MTPLVVGGTLRLALAGLIGAHGWLMGVLIAVAITGFEVIGTLFLALNRYSLS